MKVGSRVVVDNLHRTGLEGFEHHYVNELAEVVEIKSENAFLDVYVKFLNDDKFKFFKHYNFSSMNLKEIE